MKKRHANTGNSFAKKPESEKKNEHIQMRISGYDKSAWEKERVREGYYSLSRWIIYVVNKYLKESRGQKISSKTE